LIPAPAPPAAFAGDKTRATAAPIWDAAAPGCAGLAAKNAHFGVGCYGASPLS
jgi:hypothetical protein